MPDTQPDAIDAAFDRLEGAAAPADPIDEAFDKLEAANPAFTPASVEDATAASASITSDLRQTALLAPVTPNLSVIDDFRMKVKTAAKGLQGAQKLAKETSGKIGYGFLDLTDRFSSDDILAHAAGSGLGDVYKIAHSPEAKRDTYDTANRRFAQFMNATQYDLVATPEESEEIRAAFQFGELASRAPMKETTIRESSKHAIQSLVDEYRQKSVEHGNVTTEVANAAAYLNNLTPDEALQLRGYLAARSDRLPQNEQEALLTKSRYQNFYGHNWAELPLPGTPVERTPSIAFSALQTLLGTNNPGENVLNRITQVDRAYRAKDLGFIKGDLRRPGIQVPDLSAPGGFLDVDLVPTETLTNLEKRKREKGVLSPFTVEAEPGTVEQVQAATGLSTEEASKAVSQTAALESARAAQRAGYGAHADQKVGSETFTATEWNALSMRNKAIMRLGGAFGPAFEDLMKPFNAWREKQRGGVGEAIAQQITYTISGDEYLAQQMHSLSDVVSVGFGLVGQYSVLRSQDVISSPLKEASKGLFPGLQAGGSADGRPLNETQLDVLAASKDEYALAPVLGRNKIYDRALQAKIFKDATTAANLWSKASTREDARAAEANREARMSTAERQGYTDSYGRLNYASDVFTSAVHNVIEGLGHSAAQVIDKPEYVPLVIGANKVSDWLLGGGMSSFQKGVDAAISSQNASAAMKTVLRWAPHEVDRLKRITGKRLDAAVKTGDQGQMVTVLQDLEAHSTALAKEWKDVEAAGVSPTGTLNRTLMAWKKASAMGVDFEDLGTIVQGMKPRGAIPEFFNYMRSKVGLPPHLTETGLRALSKSYKDLGDRLYASLNRAPGDFAEATELERLAEQAPTAEGRFDAQTKLAALQDGHAKHEGVAKRTQMYAELEHMYSEAAAGRGYNPKRFSELRAKLWGEPDMSDLDFATVLQLSDTKRFAKNGPVNHFMARRFGYTPDQLNQITEASRRVLDFAASDAQDYYLTKIGSELRNARGNRAYAVANEKVRIAGEALEREYINVPKDARYEARAKYLQERKTQLAAEQRRSQTNPVTSRWVLDDDKILMQTITDNDLATILDTDPALFGGARREDFIVSASIEGEEFHMSPKSRELRSLYSKPSLEDQIYKWKSIGHATRLSELESTIQSIKAQAKKGVDVQEELASAAGEQAAIEEKITLSTKQAMRHIGLLAEDSSAQVSAHLIGAELSGLGGNGLPFWGKARALHELPRLVGNQQSVQMVHINDLHAELENVRRTLAPELQGEFDRAMRTGRIKGTIADYPKFKDAFDKVYPSGEATVQSNVESFLQHAESFRVNMLEERLAAGKIDRHMYKNLVEKGYDPHQYGVHEVSQAINDDKLKKMAGNLRTGEGTQKIGMGQESFMFQRDLFKHRVRVREADGFIYDEKFPNEKLANDWIRRTYGTKTAESMKGGKEGITEGTTPSGDRIVLAAPIGKEGIEILGLSTKTPELMLRSFQDMIQDHHLGLLLDSLRSTGLVIDELEHQSLLNRFGDSARDFGTQFKRLPNDKARLGNLAGKFVHSKVFSEINNYQHSFDQFRTWTETISDSFRASGESAPQELLDKTPGLLGRGMRTVNRLVKNSGILQNFQSWSSNVLFNVTLSHIVDGKIFDPENMDSWKLATREILQGPKSRVAMYKRSQIYMDFVEDGFSSGKAFESEIQDPSTRAFLRAFDLDNPTAVRKNLEKYKALQLEYEKRLALGEHPQNLAKVQLHAAALRTVLDHYERGIGKRVIQKLVGFNLNNKNLLGLPNSETMKYLQVGYGAIDEMFKFVNYQNLRKRMSRADAKWEIEQHFQDYSKVPYGISSLANNPIGSLIPSFPFELARLTKNLIKNKPLRTLSTMSVIRAVNMLSAATAGVDEDRVDAALIQAGHKNAWERYKAQFTELRLWNPVTHEPVATVSAFNLLPFGQLMEGRGLLAQMAENFLPEEDRTFTTGLVADGMKMIANGIGNNPLLNTLGVMAFNKDPLTGQDILDYKNGRPSDWAKAAWKHLGRMFVPRAALLVAEDLPRSLSAPVDPVTGKPAGAPHWTELLSSQVGVRIKGLQNLFTERARVKGRPLSNDEGLVKSAMYEILSRGSGSYLSRPQFGPDQDLRWYTAALADPRTTPEAKESYEKELKNLLHKEREVSVLGRNYKISSTEKQDWLAAGRLEEKGVPALFNNATPEEQALILSWVDRGGARTETIGELINMATRSPTGRHLFEGDPEALRKGREVLKARLGEAGADPRIGELYNYWTRIQPKAAGMWRKKRMKDEAMKGK